MVIKQIAMGLKLIAILHYLKIRNRKFLSADRQATSEI